MSECEAVIVNIARVDVPSLRKGQRKNSPTAYYSMGLRRQMVQHIFVYGTLKTGQLREDCWPHHPLVIEKATVRGQLYDLGSYPALRPGDDIIEGEAWKLAELDLPETLSVLDEIEGFYDSPRDLYKRVTIECELIGDQCGEHAACVTAFTYHFSTTLDEARRIQPSDDGLCRWPVT